MSRMIKINFELSILKAGVIVCKCFILIFFFGCATNQTTPDGAKPLTLFDTSMTKWTPAGDAEWNMLDGILTGSGGVGYMVSNKKYADFTLTAEFLPDEIVNSGIFIRCPQGDQSATGCYEVNIWDDHINQDFRTGAIVTHGKPIKKVDSAGKWNQYKIKAFGNRIEVWLNGIKTADIIDEKSKEGYIALQVNGGGVIKFRNVQIEER